MAQMPSMDKVGQSIGERLTRLENPTALAMTGAAGSTAQVTATKQANGTILYTFTIPKGDKGDTGPQGDTGPTGPAGTTTWGGITDKPPYFTSKGISMGRLP